MQTSGGAFWGHGAPPASPAPGNGQEYTNVDNFAKYFAFGGAWHLQSTPAAVPGNATSIQGVAVSATPPTAGQVLTYNAVSHEWEPT